MYAYPDPNRDDPAHVLSLLGTLWSLYYGDKKQLLAMVDANLELMRQQRQNLHEAVSCTSRKDIPLYHTERLVLLELPVGDGTRLRYPKPTRLWHLPMIMNRITGATLLLQEGIDYIVESTEIVFIKNPAENPEISQDAGMLYMWGVSGKFDLDYIFSNYGRMLWLPHVSEKDYDALKVHGYSRYKAVINAVCDCIVNGTTTAGIEALLAAAMRVPTADGEETVLSVAEDRRGRFIVTSRNIYRIGKNDVLATPVGTQPRAGAQLVEHFRVLEADDSALEGVGALHVFGGMANTAKSIDVAPEDLDVDSCICIQLAEPGHMYRLHKLLHRVLPPQTGVVFAKLGDS